MGIRILIPPQTEYPITRQVDFGDIRIIEELEQKPSQVIFNNNYIIYLTNDTIDRNVVWEGYTFHDANGQEQIGSMNIDLSRTCISYDILNNKNIIDSGYGCRFINPLFNQPVTIGNNVTSCYYMFGNCANFNQPVTIPDNVVNCYSMFSSCYNFNQPVTIGNNVTNCEYMFGNCANFNQPVTIPDNVISCYYMFDGCYVFNQPVTIPDSVINCYGMFNNCRDFNQPVTIPDNVTGCQYMFTNCTNLNQPVTIGNNINYCMYMFNNCRNFNQPVTIGNNVTSCAYMFGNCRNFNQPVTIGNNVTSCAYMFGNCIIFNQNVYIKRETTPFNILRMFQGHNNNFRVNLFCNNLALLNATTATTSLVGAAITWTDMTNGYYNAAYNIYLYNNMPEGI